VACATDFTILPVADGGADANASVDAADDGAHADGSADAGITTNDGAASETGAGGSSDAGDAANGGPLFRCGNGPAVTDCSQCAGAPVECALCYPSTGRAYFCVAIGDSCYAIHEDAGLQFCNCTSQDASDCPLSSQICYTGLTPAVCAGCGENLTDGLACKQGGTCKQATGACL
jgi:hypothetical protein